MPTNAECVHGLLLAFALLVTAHWTVELLYLTPPAREVHGGDPHHHHLLHRPGHSIHRPSASSAEFLARTTHNHSLAAQWLRYYTARPHVAGTPVDREQAAWTAERWREFGWPDVRIETYHPLLNYPRAQGQRVAIVAPPSKRHECTLKEEPVDGDDASRRYRDAVPAFHGYSADGNVTGRLIYVNYGRPADFAMLHARGVDFRGSIALVRYGRQFRGLKVRAAEQYGCAGVLVFSDPADDGYARGKTYPDGPWRPASSLQRGSVHYTSLEPGDPSTPGYPAHRNATRVPQADAKSLPKIPSLPLSYRDAQPLLQALVGHGENVTADAEWRGALDIEYWTGPGDVEVNLVNRVDYRITPIWNVLAKVEGTDPHEQAVILGNHRDAWVVGAVDPSSGSACLMEVARGLGELMRTGWRPRRTIILASWDGEEYGMVGSVEHVEDHRDWLKQNALAYLNVDTAVSGPYFRADATPSLSTIIQHVAQRIMDPRTGGTVFDQWHDYDGAKVGELGSGSDFIGFVDHVGVASVNFHFSGPYGVYHSNYDSFHWMETQGDPGFHYHTAATQFWGMLALELADAPSLLPLNYTDYANQLVSYVHRSEKTISEGLGMEVHLLELRSAARDIEIAYNQLTEQCSNVRPMWPRDSCNITMINDRLMRAERAFMDSEGIPGRPWYKHVVYAPGLWSGYGADTFPTLNEAIEGAIEGRTSWADILDVQEKLAIVVRRVAAVLRVEN